MGLTRADAERCGIGHLWVDAPAGGDLMATTKRSKYRAVATTYNGVRYSSKAEACRAEALDDQVGRGLVAFWLGQPTFRLGVAENVYRADFLVYAADRLIHAEDVKGVATPKFNRDVKLWRRFGPCDLWVIRRGKLDEIIHPGGGED